MTELLCTLHTIGYWILGLWRAYLWYKHFGFVKLWVKLMNCPCVQLLLSLISTFWYLSSDSIAIRVLTHKVNVSMCPMGAWADGSFLSYSGVMCIGKVKLAIYSKAHLPPSVDFVWGVFYRVPKKSGIKDGIRGLGISGYVDILYSKWTCALSWLQVCFFWDG